MKLAFLTTPTTHHAYFAAELTQRFEISLIIEETSSLKATFETAHDFELEREVFETQRWFKGKAAPALSDLAPYLSSRSVNDPEVLARLRELKPDVVLDFGTGKVRPELIAVCPQGIINLHGGDPEHYRGLDSHLWAIYHQEFEGLVTTLHRLNAELDDGEILLQAALPICDSLPLYGLRAVNTEVCLQLARSALAGFAETGSFIGRPQRSRGRYYSFMPAALKALCVKRFENYSRSLT